MTTVAPWPVAALGDVAETSLGKMLDAGRPKGAVETPYLRNINVQWGHIDTADVATVPLSDAERCRFSLMPGDLLVCEGGAIGRAAIWHGPEIAYQKALHRVRSRGDLDLRWLRYLLEHYDGTGVLAARATGSTIKHLPQAQLRQLPVPLPSLAEQRRIVDVLEDHLSCLDAGQQQMEHGRRSLKALTAARTDEFLSTVVDRARIGDVLREPMRNGHSARASTDGLVRTLTLTAITRGDFSDRYTKMTSADPARVRDMWLRSGDVLVQRSNTPQLVGTSALYSGPDNWAIFPDLIIRLRPDESRVSPGFLALALGAERVHRDLRARAKGLAGSMPKVDQAAIAATVIPLPLLAMQHQIVDEILDLQVMTLRISHEISEIRTRGHGLRRALLDAAFSGRL